MIKMMFFSLLLILNSCFQTFGAGIFCDYLLIGNDTLRLYSSLYEVPVTDISKFYNNNSGYITYWRLEDKRLYLIGIKDGENRKRIDLSLIFGNDAKNGSVFANWVSGEIIQPLGKRTDFGDISTYEFENVFLFDKGLLIKNYKYDNTKTYKSIFTQDIDSTLSTVYSKLNWDILPRSDDSKIVALRVISGEEKDKFQISILKGIDSLYDNEAMRVAILIPNWDVLYVHGKLKPMFYFLKIDFSNKARQQYDRRSK